MPWPAPPSSRRSARAPAREDSAPPSAARSRFPPRSPNPVELYQANFFASWEIDLWGKIEAGHGSGPRRLSSVPKRSAGG